MEWSVGLEPTSQPSRGSVLYLPRSNLLVGFTIAINPGAPLHQLHIIFIFGYSSTIGCKTIPSPCWKMHSTALSPVFHSALTFCVGRTTFPSNQQEIYTTSGFTEDKKFGYVLATNQEMNDRGAHTLL